jgi:serine/threonine protein kinase
MALKVGTVLRTAFDTYTIQGLRGAGISGEVFEAVDAAGAPRAVKVLDAARTGFSGLRRARDEFNFCSRTAHKNIVPVLDCGRTGPKAVFYVMPLYPSSLRRWIMRGIPAESVLRAFGQILDGVEAAHLHSIRHGSLRPENILASEDGRDLAVSDFGIARFEEEDMAAAGDSHGHERHARFAYAAPEQKIRGGVVDTKADVYALGVMLHEMFTGKATIGLGHADIADVAPSFAYLDWTVGRMTNPEPGRRLSVTEVKRELIARGQEFLSIQRLNALKTEIILETDVDDPIIRHPITIQSVDFKGETLYLTLSALPPPNWVKAFHESGSHARSHPGSGSHGPERFIFLGKLAHLKVTRGSDPQQLLEFAKLYVEAANRLYAEMTVAAQRENLEHEREKRRAQIAAEERRQQVLARLRL